MWEKLKSFLTDGAVFHSLLLICVAVAAFGLGRHSVLRAPQAENLENKPRIEVVAPVKREGTSSSTQEEKEVAPTSNPAAVIMVVGSKSGTKYHLPDCPGAKRIKPENLITFESVDAAKAAGYTPAANCPGLQ